MEFTTRLDAIRQDIYDVKKFRAGKPSDFSFQPGQYFLLSITSNKKDTGKPFTFTSSPTDDFIEFAIKKIGKFTGKVHSLEKCAKIHIKGPFGDSITFSEDIKDDLVLLSGGSGIAPFISTMRFINAKHLSNKVILFNANRTHKDIMFKKELEYISDQNKNIKIVHTLTREEWEGETGYFNKDMIKRHVKKLSSKRWYICGTPKLVDMTKPVLSSIGIDDDKIKSEKWLMLGKK